MSIRIRTKLAAGLAVVPMVASLGVTATAPSASAAMGRQQAYNGGFELGRTGWAATTPRTRTTIVKRGLAGSKAVKLTNRRYGHAVLVGRQNLVSPTTPGSKVEVTAYVRTNQRAVRGRMVLRQTGGPRAVSTNKYFTAVRKWRKVTMVVATKESTSHLGVRFMFYRLKKNRSVVVDGIRVLPILPAQPAPAPAPRARAGTGPGPGTRS